jgi:FADH2 O2-dependent halogenase
VFPGGWVWVLKFNNGITSAGAAATDAVANALKFNEGEAAWKRLLRQVPSLAEACGRAEAIMPFVYSPRLSFRSETVTGAYWALLPSAAGFVDPLLSTGFPLTLLGVKRLGGLLRPHANRSSLGAELEAYSRQTLLEVDTAAQLVGALYANMDRFDVFKELSLLYFVAASFSETARRLGKSHLADSFLLCRHPVFGKQLRQICAAARSPLSVTAAADLRQQIHSAIEPFDVAGLADESRDPWYPCAVADLFRNAAKVEANETEISTMLRRCGLT